MLFALGTFAFLALLWLITVTAAATLEQSGGKIVAALKGASRLQSVQPITVRVRNVPRHRRPLRANSRLRAAA
jgi:hypothetical protein